MIAEEARAAGGKLSPQGTPARNRRGKTRKGEGRHQGGEEGQADPWEIALKLLAVRARSREEMRLSLSQRGYAPEAVAGVLERLTAARYLNDREFARDWVQARAARSGISARPWGNCWKSTVRWRWPRR